jgi:hypothetical protein
VQHGVAVFLRIVRYLHDNGYRNFVASHFFVDVLHGEGGRSTQLADLARLADIASNWLEQVLERSAAIAMWQHFHNAIYMGRWKRWN